MRKLLIAFVVLASTTSFAGVNPKLAKEIRSKTKIDLTKIDLDQKGRDFVAVKFKIVNNEIQILNMNGSRNILESRVKQELESMKITSEYEEGRKYIYRFTFEKEQ